MHTQPTRLAFLDGIRGVCALYVVVCHSYTFTHGAVFDANDPAIAFSDGHFAVDVFLIVSGYGLGLSALKHGMNQSRFFARRARRILPPYYAALAIALALIWLQFKTAGIDWVPDPKQLLANLLLLNDLYPDLNASFPFWSVAVEWRLYFLFPLLVFVFKRWGTAALFACAAVLAVLMQAAIATLFPHLALDGSCPWYVVLLAMGLWGAYCQPDRLLAKLMLIGSTGLVVAGFGTHAGVVFCDLAVGGFAVSAIAWLRYHPKTVLSSSLLVFVGSWSYSLYLSHVTTLYVVAAISKHWHWPPLAIFWLGIVTAVVAAYGFYGLFERPFQVRSMKNSSFGLTQIGKPRSESL